MILGAFLIRPIPLPVQESVDLDVGLGDVSSPVEPQNSSHAPLMDYDFAAGIDSNAAHYTDVNNGHLDESHPMEDLPSHHDGDNHDLLAPLSPQPTSFDQSVEVMPDQKPNLHGTKLWLSGDFWLHFAILTIRKVILRVLISN